MGGGVGGGGLLKDRVGPINILRNCIAKKDKNKGRDNGLKRRSRQQKWQFKNWRIRSSLRI